MTIKKKRCARCRQWFRPWPTLGNIQRFCSKARCQRERHRQACLDWHNKHPHYNQKESRRRKIRAWAKRRNYWHNYRNKNRSYRLRDNARRRRLYKRLRLRAKRDALRQIALGKLQSIRDLRIPSSAKRDACDPRMENLLEFLIWKESSARRDGIALAAGVGDNG
ncbi:MAG: hypothetical protein HY547_01605 [Elusimicrobia bacterium]|nr:hypothetical protein [Elusimicrobiota bacterium]